MRVGPVAASTRIVIFAQCIVSVATEFLANVSVKNNQIIC